MQVSSIAIDTIDTAMTSRRLLWHWAGLRKFALGLLFCLSSTALASEVEVPPTPDPPETEYTSGLEFISPDVYASFPKLPVYRAYLPEQVDPSNLFPTPGYQGTLNACVGWAVGYAARSYYSHSVEQHPRDDVRYIPNPGYIYNRVRPDNDCKYGVAIQPALNLLKGHGSLSLADHTGSLGACRRPSAREVKEATGFRIVDWIAIDTKRLDAIKGELARKTR